MPELIGPMPEVPEFPTPWKIVGSDIQDAEGRFIGNMVSPVADIIVEMINEKFGKTQKPSPDWYLSLCELDDLED